MATNNNNNLQPEKRRQFIYKIVYLNQRVLKNRNNYLCYVIEFPP